MHAADDGGAEGRARFLSRGALQVRHGDRQGWQQQAGYLAFQAAVGTLRLNCDTLAGPMRDQYLVCFTAERGSPSHNALRLLSVVGTQDMTVTMDNE